VSYRAHNARMLDTPDATTTAKRLRKPANLTLSNGARWYARRLKKRLGCKSESGLVETLIINEAIRLGLKKTEAA
jgi:hypothetical protein